MALSPLQAQQPKPIASSATGDRFIFPDPNNDGEAIIFLLSDRKTKTYDLSLQRRHSSKIDILGQIRPLHPEAWIVTHVERVPVSQDETTALPTAEDAAMWLLKTWQVKRLAARKRELVAA